MRAGCNAYLVVEPLVALCQFKRERVGPLADLGVNDGTCVAPAQTVLKKYLNNDSKARETSASERDMQRTSQQPLAAGQW